MEHYIPTLESERCMLDILIPNALNAINMNTEKEFVRYYNVRYQEDTYGDNSFWTIICDINMSKTDGSEQFSKDNVTLIKIPKLTSEGFFKIYRAVHYTIIREKLLPNNIICSYEKQKASAKKLAENHEKKEDYNKNLQHRVSVISSVRSTNFSTLESREIYVKRSYQNSLIMLNDKTNKIKVPINKIISKSKRDILLLILDVMKVSDKVRNIILDEVDYSEGVEEHKNIFPSNKSAEKIGEQETSLGFIDINSEDIEIDIITIINMVVNLVSVEIGERDEDDQNSYMFKGVEDYGVFLSLIIRHKVKNITISKCKHNIYNISNEINEAILGAILENNWQVIKEYNTDLQLARHRVDFSPEEVQACLHEVIITTSDNANKISQDFNLRHIHPEQLGFVCIIRTTDDEKAGLKKFLASDCIISRKLFLDLHYDRLLNHEHIHNDIFSEMSNYLENRKTTGSDFNVLRLLYNYYSNDSSTNNEMILWIHNGTPIQIAKKSRLINMLNDIKYGGLGNNFEFSWNISRNVLYSRLHYGRYMSIHLVMYNNEELEVLLDCQEVEALRSNIIREPSPFSVLYGEIPYVEHMAPPRANLAMKNISSAISYSLLESEDVEKSNLVYIQKPLVTTTTSRIKHKGTNAVVGICTYEGSGTEDGMLISKRFIESGGCSIYQKLLIEWDNFSGTFIDVEVKYHVKVGSTVLYNTPLATITYIEKTTSKPVTTILLSKYNFKAKVSRIKTMENDKYPKNILGIKIMINRRLEPEVGSKISTRFGQKAVIVRVVKDTDLPFSDDPRFATFDIIINSLSIFSRATMSQSISSAMSILTMELGIYEASQENLKNTILKCNNKIKEGFVPVSADPEYVSSFITKIANIINNYENSYVFSDKYQTNLEVIDYLVMKYNISDNQDGQYRIDHTKVKDTSIFCYDGKTGEIIENPIVVGIEYILILPHIADIKIKPGSINKSDKSNVKYGWQEMYALLDHGDEELLHNIYNTLNTKERIPYCNTCNKMYNRDKKFCDICRKEIENIIDIPKHIENLSNCLNCIGLKQQLSLKE